MMDCRLLTLRTSSEERRDTADPTGFALGPHAVDDSQQTLPYGCAASVCKGFCLPRGPVTTSWVSWGTVLPELWGDLLSFNKGASVSLVASLKSPSPHDPGLDKKDAECSLPANMAFQ